jgi:polygalacturonase
MKEARTNKGFSIFLAEGKQVTMDLTHTVRCKYTYVVLATVICATMVAFFVSGTVIGSQKAHAATTLCNVKSFGAVGNGTTKDTAAIQKAINSCASAGGGTVEIPAGNYLSAPLFLKSNITLQVDTGATLDASKTLSDYTIPAGVIVKEPVLAFINGYQLSNVGITGGGLINGEGSVWWSTGKVAHDRPRLIELAYATTVTVSNINLENAGSMHLFFFGSSGISVNNITITAPSTSPNTDGIDFSYSKNAVVNHCNIDTGDDDVAIVSGISESSAPQLGASNILVENCNFKHGHGLSIGSGTTGSVHDITASNITFNGTTNGLRIKSNRTVGGQVYNVSYSNLTMTGVKTALLLTGYYPSIPSSDTPQPITNTTPYYHNITITNLVATGSTTAGTIVGVPEEPFTAITLNAVKITAKKGIEVRNATVTVTHGTTVTVSSGSAYILESQGKVVTA